jgi:hypothetical protein
LLYRRSQADRLLLAFSGAVLAAFILLIGNKTPLYAILAHPFFILLVAAAFGSLVRELPRYSKHQVFVAALFVLFLGNSAISIARPIIGNRGYEYEAITEQIKTVIPPDARVMGLPTWWIGLADYDYRSSLNLTFYNHFNGYNLNEALEAVHPDIIILDDGGLGTLLVNEGEILGDVGQEIYALSREEFTSFLAERGEMVLEFTDPVHGRFQIYAIRWES